MTTSPKKIGPLIPVVGVALIVVAAVAYDTWFSAPEPTSDTTMEPTLEYRKSLPVSMHYVPGHPEMTQHAAYSSFELQIAYLRDVLGFDVAQPRDEDREVWTEAVKAEYAYLSPTTRTELAESSRTLHRFRASWAKLAPDEKRAIREKARGTGGVMGPEAITARHAPLGLRVQLCRSALRGWPGFIDALREVPMASPDGMAIAWENVPIRPVHEG